MLQQFCRNLTLFYISDIANYCDWPGRSVQSNHITIIRMFTPAPKKVYSKVFCLSGTFFGGCFCFVFATVPFLWFPELAYTKVQLLCTFPVYHKELQDCLELLPPANREKYYINLLRQKIIKLMYLQCNDVFKFSSWILQMKRLPNVIHIVTPKIIYTQACLASKQAAQREIPHWFLTLGTEVWFMPHLKGAAKQISSTPSIWVHSINSDSSKQINILLYKFISHRRSMQSDPKIK